MFKKLLKIVIPFFSFQILIQAIDAISGILIVRQLPKPEYAFFGIASTIAASVMNISLGGVGSYLIAEGVKLKNSPEALSKLCIEVYNFINKKKWIVIFISIPLIFWLLRRNDLAIYRICFFVLLIMSDVLLRVRLQVYQSVLNVWEQFNQMQAISLRGSCIRLLVVAISFLYFSGEIAYMTLVVSCAIQLWLTKKKTEKYLVPTFSNSTERVPALQKLYISQLPINLYYYVDAQLGVFIITFWGNTILLADVNAAYKLSLIMVVINAFINNFVVVKFAKVNERIKFIKLSMLMFSVFLPLYILAFLFSIFFPQLFILVIGAKYSNLSPLLYLPVISICLANFSSLLYAINYSRTWIYKNWIAIPFTIVLQLLLIKFMPPKNFTYAWYYIILSACPILIVNIYCYLKGVKGFKNA